MNSIRAELERLTPKQRQLLARWLSASYPHRENDRRQLLAYVKFATNLSADDEQRVIERLMRALREQLPRFMVPESITPLRAFPRLPNGKLDPTGLPEPALRERSERSEPTNEVEQTLLGIWQDLLQTETLGVHDDFFEFGGDSIISIQVISRAREAGLKVEPRQLADSPTIAELAKVVSKRQTGAPSEGPFVGKATALPIQTWFLERQLQEPHHWNQCRSLQVSPKVTTAHLERAIQCCIDHHDALRSRFVREEGTWLQIVPECPHPPPKLPVLSAPDEQLLADIVRDMQAGLSIGGDNDGEQRVRGELPLIRFALVSLKGTRQLVIVAHHLVIDHISWLVLLEDLNRLCELLTAGHEAELPPKTTSTLEWSRRLQAFAESAEAEDSIAFWKSEQTEASLNTSLPTKLATTSDAGLDSKRLSNTDTTPSIPRDLVPDGPITESSAKTLTVSLGCDETSRLLASNETYRTKTFDILLTALAQTLTEWCSGDVIRIDLEGHGRDLPIPGADVSRTVGWFTSYYPLKLDLTGCESNADAMKTVKEQRAKLPHGGASFGVLRYVASGDGVRRSQTTELRAIKPSDLLFNFQGHELAARPTLLTIVDAAEESSRSMLNERSHPIEVNASIQDGCLCVRWTYSSQLHRVTTIQQVASQFVNRLMELVEHCLSPGSGGFTPSDFPDVELTQDELDELLEDLE